MSGEMNAVDREHVSEPSPTRATVVKELIGGRARIGAQEQGVLG